jgi:hypothetical protein
MAVEKAVVRRRLIADDDQARAPLARGRCLELALKMFRKFRDGRMIE